MFMSMSPPETPAQAARRELILYATPNGELGRACERFFASVSTSGRATTAQTYPPHVTLTGFFRRSSSEVERVIAEAQSIIDAAPGGAVTVHPMQVRTDWLGLEITSDWLSEVARAFADQHRVEPGDDAIRLKDWLHLSLAYGTLPAGASVADYVEEATSTIKVEAPVTWSVGLWERRGGDWIRHC